MRIRFDFRVSFGYIALMFLATSNKVKQVLLVSYIGRVTAEELKRGREEAEPLFADLKPGFIVLTDLGRLECMDTECVPEIGKLMELCDGVGPQMAVRVIPDPSKDIGLNIIGAFHYRRDLRVVTCETMEEAAKALGL